MVTRSPPRRSRGQLILIGCLALAFVVVSVGLLINTTLYTETASPALSNAQVDTTRTFDYETRLGTRALIHRINHGEFDRSESELDDDVTGAVSAYSALLAEHYARNEPAVVEVTYNHGNDQVGTRVIQPDDGDFYEPANPQNDFLAAPQRIGWYTINVNVSGTDRESATDPFTLVLRNQTEEIEIDLYRNESGVGSNLTIETRHSGTSVERNVTCNPIRNRVLLDVVTGDVVADGCDDTELYGVSDLDPPHTAIEVVRGDRFRGRWEFVTDGAGSDVEVADPCNAGITPAADEACSTPAVWIANVTTSLESDTVSFEHDRNITIYG